MQTHLYAISRPIVAKSFTTPDAVILTFATDPDKNEVSIFLPRRMDACVAMIVEAFNAHVGNAPPPVDIAEFHMPDTGIPTGSAMSTAAIVAVLGATDDLDLAAASAVERRDLP